MALSQTEFERLLADPAKRIVGDIVWVDDLSHPPARKFRVEVESDTGWPLFLQGWWNPASEKLCYTLFYRGAGRIVGLDLGYDGHTNRDGQVLRDTHKHRWSEHAADKDAYTPLDITADWHEPVEVWRQFCAETSIVHAGEMPVPIVEGAQFDDAG